MRQELERPLFPGDGTTEAEVEHVGGKRAREERYRHFDDGPRDAVRGRATTAAREGKDERRAGMQAGEGERKQPRLASSSHQRTCRASLSIQ